nr:uncharacterized protein LOC120824356 isoform X12 [Gasterosteus aculeatus aculeatus]
MRPNHGWTVLQAFVLAGMLLDLKADNENTSCEMDVKVNQNTSFETFLGEDLRINCTVEFCSDSTPSVSWNKQKNNVRINISSSTHIKTEWKRLGDLVGMSFLIFQNVGINDSGLYQCEAGGIVTHLINVSVHGDDERNNFSNDPNILVERFIFSVTFMAILSASIGVTITVAGLIFGLICKRKLGSRCAVSRSSVRETHDSVEDDPDDPYTSLQQPAADLYQTICHSRGSKDQEVDGGDSDQSCQDTYENMTP